MRTRDPSSEQVTDLRRERGREGELGILCGKMMIMIMMMIMMIMIIMMMVMIMMMIVMIMMIIMMMIMTMMISRVGSMTTTCAPTFDRVLFHKDPPDGQHTAGQLFLLWVDKYHGLIGM